MICPNVFTGPRWYILFLQKDVVMTSFRVLKSPVAFRGLANWLVTPIIKILYSNPSVDRNIRIFRQV